MEVTLQDGALALLGETTQILNENGIEYIIVGGWSPFLLNSSPLPHPGTKDVDVLFKSGIQEGELKTIIQKFLSNGFIPSAKHSFQLLKPIELNRQNFMFNIDLLHPNDQELKPGMFVDHIDFPVKESKNLRIDYKGKTIILPKSDYFFDGFTTHRKQDIQLSNGETVTAEFDLLNEAGLILSKSSSVFNEKRTRDAYDIFLAIKQSSNYDKMISELRNIHQSNNDIQLALRKMYEAEKMKIIEDNVYQWMSEVRVPEGDRIIKEVFIDFFSDINIQPEDI